MVTISQEAAAQTEARLRTVFRDSAIDWLPGTWSFVEGDEAARSDAIAEIRDEGRRSGVCPATAATDSAELFRVFRVVLPPARDDSGFVEWLASRIKEATGSGVFVLCGYNRHRGGVFDYYGVPEAAASEVRLLLNRLAGHARDSLDGVVMTGPYGAGDNPTSTGTMFCFNQRGNAVSARYGGGEILDGWLVGKVNSSLSLVSFRYLQTWIDGTVDMGESTGNLIRLADGRWRLTMHKPWRSPRGSEVAQLEEVVAS